MGLKHVPLNKFTGYRIENPDGIMGLKLVPLNEFMGYHIENPNGICLTLFQSHIFCSQNQLGFHLTSTWDPRGLTPGGCQVDVRWMLDCKRVRDEKEM